MQAFIHKSDQQQTNQKTLMSDLDETILISKYQEKKKSFMQFKQNPQLSKPPQDLQEKKLDRQKYFKQIKSNFLQDNQLSNITQLKPFKNNEEIYEFKEKFFQNEQFIEIPSIIQDEIKMALSSHTGDIPFFQKLYEDLVVIVVNNMLFLWDFENNIYQKKQFLQRIFGIGIGKPDQSIFHDVEQLLVVSLQNEIQFINIKINMQEISFIDLEMTIKADRNYNQVRFYLHFRLIILQYITYLQVLVSQGRIFIGSNCGVVKEIVYSMNSFIFFLSNQKLHIKSGGSYFMDIKQLIFKNGIKQLSASHKYLFALQNFQISVYNLEDNKLTFLYAIKILDLIQKLESERIYLPDKSNWQEYHLNMIGIQSFSQQINLIIFTQFGVRIYLQLDDQDFFIHFVKFQGYNNPNMIVSQFEENNISFKSCSDGISSFVCEENQLNRQTHLIFYQLSQFQEIQHNFQPPKNETIHFQEISCEDCEMVLKQDYQFKNIHEEIKNDIDLIQQTYLGQKKLLILFNKGIHQYSIQRPIDELKDILLKLEDTQSIPQEYSHFQKYQKEELPQQQESEQMMQNFIERYGTTYLSSMLIQLYCQNNTQNIKSINLIKKDQKYQNDQSQSDLKTVILNTFENINKKENVKMQGVILYLTRILRPFWSRTLMKNQFENFEIDELYFAKKLVQSTQEFLKKMHENINDMDNKTEVSQYLTFICECFSFIIFLSENIGFRKLKLNLDAKQQSSLEILNFGDIFEDPDNARPLLRVFLKNRNFMDKTTIIKNNFPNFFSDYDQQLYRAEILINEDQFDQASQILEKIDQISDNSLFEYFYEKYLPSKKIENFLSILFSQIEKKQILIKNKYLTKEQIEIVGSKLNLYKNFVSDIFAELIFPKDLEVLEQNKKKIIQDDKIEQYGVFKGYSYDEKSIIIKHLLKNMKYVQSEEFHINIFQILVQEQLTDYLKFCNSDYFMKIRDFIKQDPINILKAGYQYFSERNQNYEAYTFANDLYQLEHDDISENMIRLSDRKIYLYIATQNLETILKSEKDIQQRTMIQESHKKILEQQKFLNLQSFIQDSLQRNQKIIIENIESIYFQSDEEQSDNLAEIIESMDIFIWELDRKIHPLKFLTEIIQKFQLYDCYLYFSEFQNFTMEFLQSIYKKYFNILFTPEFFKRRCIDTLITIQTNLKSLDKLQLFSIKNIIEVVEHINLKNPIYLEFFQSLKNVQNNFTLHNPETNPFWLFSFLIEDLKVSETEILEIYSNLIEIDYQSEEYDQQLYFLVTIIAIIQSFIEKDQIIHESSNMKKYLLICKVLYFIKNKMQQMLDNLRCDSELIQNLERLIDEELLPNLEQKILIQIKIQKH